MKNRTKSAVSLLSGMMLLTFSHAAANGDRDDPEPLPGQGEYAERAERLLTAAVEAGDELGTAQAQHALAEHMKTLSLWPQALTHARLARDAAQDIDDANTRVAIEITYASILSQLERTAEATPILLGSLELARELENIEQQQWALLGLSSTYVSARQLEEAEEFAQQGLALARTTDDRVQQVRFLSNLGLIAWTAGDAATAGAYIQRATEVEAGELPPDVHKTLILASITLAGTTGESSALKAREVIQEARRDGSRYMEAFASEQLGHILCGDGEFEEGLEAFASADRLFRESDRLGDLWRMHERWATCLEGAGRLEDALERQREAMRLLDMVHERRQNETLLAHDIAFRTEQRVAELARLAGEEQALQARIARQRAFTGWLTAGTLLLLGIVAGFWLRNHRLREHRDAQMALQQARIDLLARASHEIRNPAQGIIGILEGWVAGNQDDADSRRFEVALSAARMVAHMSNDYLDLALLEQGKLSIQNDAVCNLGTLIEQMTELARSFIHAPGQHLTTRIGDEVPDTVYADSERLLQVLLNLVSNAAHYAGEGEIALAVSLDSDKQKLLFKLADRGPGFNPSSASNFDPYARGDRSGDNPRGSGLGLAISARIVNAMGGTLLIRNRASGGAELSLSFPLRVPPGDIRERESGNARKIARKQHLGRPGTRRVLIVDDDPFARTGLCALIESTGGEVEEMNSSAGLEQTVLRFDPDIVLVDYRLGDTSGIELAKRVRQLDRGRAVARTIAIISGSDPEEHAGDTDGLVDRWLVKPVGRDGMVELLSEPS